MKLKLIILMLLISIAVTGCGNKEVTTPDGEPTEVVENNSGTEVTPAEGEATDGEETDVDPVGAEHVEGEVPEDEITGEDTPDGEITDTPKETDTEEPPQSYTEEITALVNSSDYISIIKMTQTGSSGKEIHVMEDLKGSLKNIVIPELPNMEANKDYLVFLMDSENGDITLTDIDKAMIYVADETNEALKITRELLAPAE